MGWLDYVEFLTWDNLTKHQQRVLTAMYIEDTDVAYEHGYGWYVGNEPFDGKTAHAMIRMCLLTALETNTDVEYFVLSHRAIELLKNEFGEADLASMFVGQTGN